MTQPVPLDALLRRLSRLAEQHFDHHGDIDPMWLVETADGEQKVIVSPIVVPNPLAGAEYKDRLAETMRETFRDMDVVRYAWAAECWIDSAYDPNETDEIISFEAEDSTELLWASREIIRPQHGKPYLGKLSEIERPTISGGRFRGLLPSAAHAQAAKEVPQEPERRLRFSTELPDDVGSLYATNVPGAPLQVLGRRDPATNELCVTTYDTTPGGLDLDATDAVERVTGPEAERLILGVHYMLTMEATAKGLSYDEYVRQERERQRERTFRISPELALVAEGDGWRPMGSERGYNSRRCKQPYKRLRTLSRTAR